MIEGGFITIGSHMRKILLSLFFLLPFPLAAVAQPDYPDAEISGGYSYFRANPGSFDDQYEWSNLHGWNATVAANLSECLAIEGDLGGHYGSPSIYGYDIPLLDVRYYTFMAGPKLSHRSNGVIPFAHFLIGAARGSFGGGIGSFNLDLSNRNALAAAVGGGIDLNLDKRLAVRIVQADYLMTRFSPISDFPFSSLDERQNNFRISAGVVFRF
jgi:hypothetical protein